MELPASSPGQELRPRTRVSTEDLQNMYSNTKYCFVCDPLEAIASIFQEMCFAITCFHLNL